MLDGTLALVLPTIYGQSLIIETLEEPKIFWKSLNKEGKVWFECEIFIGEITMLQKKVSPKDSEITNRLIQILNEAKKLNPDFLNKPTGYKITTKLDFPRNWGLGSSSTLINNIANWAKVDAFKLLENTFGGSGFDIAAAQYNKPISYSILNSLPVIKEVSLSWKFTDQLFFVYLNKKQNSREGIIHYQSQIKNDSLTLAMISELTSKIISCEKLQEFEILINKHEGIISNLINLKPVKELLFNDYNGAIKSLGAWGGDFILVTGEDKHMEYFRKKGFETIIPFNKMIK